MLSLSGMVSGKAITIQHLSDLELGAKNRFGGAEGPLQDGGRRQSRGWVGCQVLAGFPVDLPREHSERINRPRRVSWRIVS